MLFDNSVAVVTGCLYDIFTETNKMKTKLLLTAPFVLLAACQSTGMDKSPSAAKALLGPALDRPLTAGESTFILHSDGRLAGDATGTWTVENGKYCRTVVAPAKWAGSQCQDVSIDGDQITFARPDGSATTYTIN